jgi:hypothetical protein
VALHSRPNLMPAAQSNLWRRLSAAGLPAGRISYPPAQVFRHSSPIPMESERDSRFLF